MTWRNVRPVFAYPVSMYSFATLSVTVFFKSNGRDYGVTTAGASVFDAARNALKFFRDPYWRGPKPGPDTILRVKRIAGDEVWFVRVSRVDELDTRTDRP